MDAKVTVIALVRAKAHIMPNSLSERIDESRLRHTGPTNPGIQMPTLPFQWREGIRPPALRSSRNN